MKKLAIFDFDGTLFDTLDPSIGKEMWKDKTGTEFPHQGWWSKPESLDISVLDIKPIDYIYEKYLQHKKAGDIVYLLTGRIIKLDKEVKNILDTHSISFDGVFLNDQKDTLTFKLNKFNQLLSKYGNSVEKTIIYEDRIEHIQEFLKWRNSLNEIVDIYDVKTKKVL